MSSDKKTAELLVDRPKLITSVKNLLAIEKPKPDQHAVLELVGGELVISLADAQVTAPATGSWRGQARVWAHVLTAMSGSKGTGLWVPIWIKNEKIHIDKSAFPCLWLPGGPEGIRLAPDANLGDILALGETYPLQRLAAAGILPLIERALEKRNEAINAAAAALAPFGVRRETIVQAVDDAVSSRKTKP